MALPSYCSSFSRFHRFLICAICVICGFVAASAAENRLVVTVSNEFGFPITNLKAEDFIITQERVVRSVKSANYTTHSLADVVLLLDTSEVGARLRGEIEHTAGLFVDRLGEKDQMAIIGYATSADLVQDFTSSKKLLKRAIGGLRYGNRPALLDSVYAAVDGAFERSAGRRVLVVVGSGLDWRNKVDRKEVLRVARRNQVSIFAISFGGDGDLEKLTEETAGEFFQGRELRQIQQVIANVAGAFRGHYELSLGEALSDARLKVEVRGADKYRISYRLP